MKKNNLFRIILSAVIFIFFLTSPFYAADKKAVIFPFSYTGDPSKAYIAQTIKKMLGTRLGGDGIEVVEDEKYNSILNEKEKSGNISAEKIREYAVKLKAEYAVYGSVTTAGASSSLDFSILETGKKNSKPFKISETASEDQIIVKTADVAKQYKTFMQSGKIPAGKTESGADKAKTQSTTERTLSSLKITGHLTLKKTQVMAFDLADLNGDGAAEWILLEQQIIKIFSKEDGKMIQKDSLETSLGETFLKVSAGDADGNGIPELYVVTQYGSVIRTGVWEWNGKFKKLFIHAGNVRVINKGGFQKPVLLFQDSAGQYPLSGMIYIMQYDKDGKLSRKEPLKHLENAQFYTLDIVDLDKDGNMEYLGLDNNFFLCVWDRDGESLWKSKDEMGGTNNIIKPDTVFRSDQSQNTIPSFPLNSRLVVMDIDRDGKNEIIVARNIESLSFLQNMKTYTKGNIFIYKIDGKTLVPAWTSDEIDQCINDIQTDGWTLYLAGQEGQILTVFKGSSRIMWIE